MKRIRQFKKDIGKTCCICRLTKKDVSESPFGYIEPDSYRIAKWSPADQCCTSCADQFVAPGKVYMILAKQVLDRIDTDDREYAQEIVRRLYIRHEITEDMMKYIYANWDLLVED